jgi:hypothetical protein
MTETQFDSSNDCTRRFLGAFLLGLAKQELSLLKRKLPVGVTREMVLDVVPIAKSNCQLVNLEQTRLGMCLSYLVNLRSP